MDDILFMDIGYSLSHLLSNFSYLLNGHTKTGIVLQHISLKIAFFTVLQDHVVIFRIMELVVHLQDVPVFQRLMDVDLILYFGLDVLMCAEYYFHGLGLKKNHTYMRLVFLSFILNT